MSGKIKEGDVMAQVLRNGEIQPVEILDASRRGRVYGIYTGTAQGWGIDQDSLQHVLPGDFEEGFRKEIEDKSKKRKSRIINQNP